MRVASLLAATSLAAVALTACSEASTPGPRGQVAITVSPLSLAGITEATYTVTVTNASAGGGEVVWSRALTSTRYGDGAGSLSYVGPCDASTGVNTVILDLTELRGAGGPLAPGSFADPTPITREVVCTENADTAVVFDMTIARTAQQGFFDVAVAFRDVFCSAKLDCENRETGADLALLHDATGARAMTVVLGFACAGSLSGPTFLYLDDPVIDCDGYALDVRVDPSGRGNVPLATPPNANADGYLFAAAVYRGVEGTGHIAYWNVALGLDASRFASAGVCTLRARATASTEPFPQTPLGFPLPPATVYPVIDWAVQLSDATDRTCSTHEVNVSGSDVATQYLGYLSAPNAFSWSSTAITLQHRYEADADVVLSATGGQCNPSCVRGSCTAEDTCDCTGTGYEGPTCAAPACTAGCAHGGVCTAPEVCDCDGTGFDGATCEADVDECLATNGGCAQTCTNSVGAYACSCTSGYTLAADDHACDDVDECLTDNGGCSLDATCTNTTGARTCACDPGFVGDGVTCAQSLTIAASTTNFNLFAAVGSPTAPHAYAVTINSGVVVSSTTSGLAAFRTGNLPAGSTVTLVNHGKIYGAGGAGGSAGDTTYGYSAGASGGDAISTNVALTIDNTDGEIFSGGGGGGGGGQCTRSNVLACGGSGGGGRGQVGGAAGTKGGCFAGANYPNGTAGAAGSVNGPGGGGAGTSSGYYPNAYSAPYYCTSGTGGAGGDWGQAGSPSTASILDGAVQYPARIGGSGGYAVRLSGGSVSWLGGNTAARVKGFVQ